MTKKMTVRDNKENNERNGEERSLSKERLFEKRV